MSILGILDELAATSSRLEKEAILRNNVDNMTLKRVFKLAYDKQVIFWTKQLPEREDFNLPYISLDDALTYIERDICTRYFTGHAADDYFLKLLGNVNADDAEVIKRVVLKDLRCGCTVNTANKVWKDLVEKPAFMLCHTDTKAIKYPAMSQMKEDGTRGKFIFDGETVTIISRNGNPIETHGTFDRWAQRLKEPMILDGELVAFKNGKRMVRKDSNGIVNKAVRGTITPEEAALLVYIAWDVETMNAPYSKRFAAIENWDNIVDNLDDKDKVIAVENKLVNTYEEAYEHFKDARRRGLEGTILKNIDAMWQGKRSFDLVKFKAEIEAEFKVVGFEYGKKGTKNEHRLGALHIETEDGKVKCDVGIFKDFPDTVRDTWLSDVPKIVTVRYNERITSKGSDTQSLFLPRVISVRHDKDKADTLDDLIAIEKATLE